jgi:hypothetical protein
MCDAFNSYESGLQELLERLGQSHDQYAEALTLQSRLLENIAQVRHYGDTETQRAERAQILDALNKLSVESITISFNDLVGSPYGLDITKKVQANDERYLKLAKEQYGTLRTEGLEEIPAPLADVFVMLEVVEALAHKIRTDVLPTHQQAVEMGLKEKQTSAASLRSRLQHSRAEFKPSPAPIPLAEALREHRHLVILGDPGSGKTTALQFIALCLADEELAQERLGLDEVHVPVWVDLRSYDGAEPLGEKLVSAVAALGQFDIVSTQSSQEIAKTLWFYAD